ncbi:2,3-diphosphoglycerate-dependent phosphoglycerate mutase [Roseibacterium sp. SDUM158017]|uniref:2,3-diphosphoglycerate-dependent phosphoglycerate mutase n=1 Tax=Roseicyclus salinarum TaxID=3036773 RepID=UPI0024152444|nr:2,3-diphosphoglycerate-dependent phosphoglycerate mutase [Roseibacterium sp. SDUM158017]MDG4647832.1 2,3-diphosphoglycerate-dependent phosphoglycerate mutase [Roseibacterium sp. SDUM158017]
MPRLIVLRHGESVWNRDNRFTGWTDVDLSPRGVDEARRAARLISEAGIGVDLCFTSVQKRAIRTLWTVLDDMDLLWLPVERHWRLNERHYGALQGRDKDEVRREAGEAQVHLWRRSLATRPPPLDEGDDRFPGRDPRYARLPDAEIPRAESLQDCIARTMPYWRVRVEPALMRGRTPLVVAHGNSMRGILKHLLGISDEDIPGLEIPTGVPMICEFDGALRLTGHGYLGR